MAIINRMVRDNQSRQGRNSRQSINSRSINSFRNAFSGIIKLLIKIALPFAVRTIMLYYLGKEYLGINSLFTSILSVLNLAELGFSGAVIFRLYKPVAMNDHKTVGAYLNYLKGVYQIIGIIVLCLGLILTPFLKFLIKDAVLPDINLYVIYCIYLFNTVFSYFFAGYKRAIIIVSQHMDYINLIETILFTSQYLLQIAILIIAKSYYLFILMLPVTTFCTNFLISYICRLKYSDFFSENTLSLREREKMRADVWGVAIYRISEVTRNSLDSIIISTFLGLASVAMYNNYFYIFSAVYSFMVIINQSLQASIGDSIAKETIQKNEKELYILSLFSLWLVGFCCTALVCMYQPFMHFWMGADMLLPMHDVILFSVYFYVLNMNNIRNLFYDGNGLWLRGIWTFILESITNLVLNIVLGKLLGITGVIIATIITMFFYSFVCRSIILYKSYFKRSVKCFFYMHGKMMALCLLISSTCFLICNFSALGIKFLICLTVPNIFYYFIFKKNPYFIEGMSQMKKMLKGKHQG